MKHPKRVALFTTLAVAAFACGGGSDEPAADAPAEQMSEDPDLAPTGAATALPAGFALRLDNDGANAADYRVMSMGGGLHIETGPAGVLWNPEHTVASGDYMVSAQFEQTANRANHPEAYGIFIGGSDLAGPAQAYTYFIVRGDGSYKVKKRNGAQASDVTEWIKSDAIQPTTGQGANSNALAVMVHGGQVHFSVNGTEVHVMPAADLPVYGITGVRVNHNLNVMVTNWSVAAH